MMEAKLALVGEVPPAKTEGWDVVLNFTRNDIFHEGEEEEEEEEAARAPMDDDDENL